MENMFRPAGFMILDVHCMAIIGRDTTVYSSYEQLVIGLFYSTWRVFPALSVLTENSCWSLSVWQKKQRFLSKGSVVDRGNGTVDSDVDGSFTSVTDFTCSFLPSHFNGHCPGWKFMGAALPCSLYMTFVGCFRIATAMPHSLLYVQCLWRARFKSDEFGRTVHPVSWHVLEHCLLDADKNHAWDAEQEFLLLHRDSGTWCKAASHWVWIPY